MAKLGRRCIVVEDPRPNSAERRHYVKHDGRRFYLDATARSRLSISREVYVRPTYFHSSSPSTDCLLLYTDPYGMNMIGAARTTIAED